MSRTKEPEQITGTKKEFLDRFQQLTYTRSGWQVWADLMAAWSCAIANSVERVAPLDKEIVRKREEEYAHCIKNLGGVQLPAEMLAVVTEALTRNPEQDFLGELYMELGLGSHWHGQFFTPMSLSSMMAMITLPKETVEQQIEESGYVIFNDPACGAGATLIAAAGALHQQGINYQRNAFFCGNDVDRVAAQMCYIQISLLGCPGWVAITNTLTNPTIGDPIQPEEKEGQEYWYTPFYYTDVWAGRRMCHTLDRMIGKPQKHYFTFDFGKEEVRYA